jgi:hypothetical protein
MYLYELLLPTQHSLGFPNRPPVEKTLGEVC